MEKAYLETLDVVRAGVAELYRLRREEAGRLDRLERLARPEMVARIHDGGIAEHRPGSGEADGSRI